MSKLSLSLGKERLHGQAKNRYPLWYGPLSTLDTFGDDVFDDEDMGD